MAEYPYVNTTDKFREFMIRLQGVGVPLIINKKYLQSLGYKSSNHQRFPVVLKAIGLLDSENKPTGALSKWKDRASGPTELGRLIRETYLPLFQIHPSAHEVDKESLRNFFASSSGLGDQAVGAMIDTFKVLCGLATFGDSSAAPVVMTGEATESPVRSLNGQEVQTRASVPALHIDIQIHIDSTASAEQIDQVFASMARHLYGNRSSE